VYGTPMITSKIYTSSLDYNTKEQDLSQSLFPVSDLWYNNP